MFRHPAAPAPNATKNIPIRASEVLVFEFEVKNPTAQVNITRDITLGFINKYNDLIKVPKSNSEIEAVLFLIVLDKTNLRLLQRIL
tara:strand:+ start:160 stop:417 length:258 start_codon:yes stop_codon:yes gene_type:complete